ncbi:DUF2614 family zinc ribbon-containing protein [Paenibacillus xylaniclasticus]|uniref:DUF2614 family zinc ribbon-containing protein n=1 Tax=Paenibacillus xylaniclasticus TaxID=588083 RepID=UPI000FDBE16E|nr:MULTISPECIES: DUF2614 family zinc ribbon-containing protein [Paenibacillus]GFN29744.1 UPF0295 protein [Paenibacillus curdlanolyticus]
MFFKTAKINEFRLWGLLFMLGGMGMMIFGTAGIVFFDGTAGRIFAGTFMVLGSILMLISVGIYFWAGMMSTSVKTIQCPECGKHTKMIGRVDRCMHCKTKMTVDPSLATDLDDETFEPIEGQQETATVSAPPHA